jgi:hypothetical protein
METLRAIIPSSFTVCGLPLSLSLSLSTRYRESQRGKDSKFIFPGFTGFTAIQEGPSESRVILGVNK